MKNKEIKTTGQLRTALAKACQDVLSGELDVEKAQTLHKLAKNISESLYSETKIAMFRNDVGMEISEIGELHLGDKTA
jgi:hypothetical protein